jgi:hypothetical protein
LLLGHLLLGRHCNWAAIVVGLPSLPYSLGLPLNGLFVVGLHYCPILLGCLQTPCSSSSSDCHCCPVPSCATNLSAYPADPRPLLICLVRCLLLLLSWLKILFAEVHLTWSVTHGVDLPFCTTTINCCLLAMSAPSWHDRPFVSMHFSQTCSICALLGGATVSCVCASPPYWPNTSSNSCCLSGSNSLHSFATQFPSLARHVFGFAVSPASESLDFVCVPP